MTPPKLAFELSREEKNSRLFKKLLTYWEERLNTLRTQNDGNHEPLETANLRGRIAELKLNLSLDKEKPGID